MSTPSKFASLQPQKYTKMKGSSKILSQFITERQADFPLATGEFTSLMQDIVIAAKIVNREVNKAGLVNILGETGTVNVQGEKVKKLDEFANNQFISALRSGGECCVIASEENEDIIAIDNTISKDAKYVVTMDPLDGSSNIDVNTSIGTIFGIYLRKSNSGPGTVEDCLQKGSDLIAAGYVLYGSSTMLVYTTGNGVNGFTLDPSIGEFCHSHPKMKIPQEGKIISINEGNYAYFDEKLQKYLQFVKKEDKNNGKPYNARYIGSLVADFHRNLLKGGIFLYPASGKAPKGKLRLVYESIPLAFIIEQAGGKAIAGKERILDIKPTELHQRTPLIIGCKTMVDEFEKMVLESNEILS